MAKDANKAESKTFTGTVVAEGGLVIGTKSPKRYPEGKEFKTDNEKLYQNLLNRKIIK